MARARSKGLTAARLGATAVVALLVAEGAVVLLAPRDVVDPVAVDEAGQFAPTELNRARDYAAGQRLIGIGSLVLEGALLVALVGGRPRRAIDLLDRAGQRPVLGGLAAGTGLALALGVATTPLALAAHERAVDAGLSTQGTAEWALDHAKALALNGALTGAVAAAALTLMRRFGARWWLPGSAAFAAVAVLFVWVVPVVVAPLFNDFEKLEPGPARSDTLELAARADVRIGEVYRIDASRRTTGINAYVDGIGSTKRVVLYDTLIDGLDRGERRSVIAHELGHAKANDIPRGLAWLAISAPLAILFASGLATRLAARQGVEPGTPAFLPALALSLAVTSIAIGAVGNQLSRQVEARADTFALELTDDPGALIKLQRHLAVTNLSDPDPPAVFRALFGSHPTATERIGAALAWQAGERP